MKTAIPYPSLLDQPRSAAPTISWQQVPSSLMTTYHRAQIDFVHGQGTRLWDSEGREYLDAVAGVGVTQVGHAHPAIVTAISDQATRLLHTSNLYSNVWQIRLAERLTALSGMQRAFFCNSGAEANEAAIKLARLYANRRGIAQPLIVVMENAFHGRTLATLSASDSEPVQRGFGPLVEGFIRVPFGDLAAIEAVTETHGTRIVAVLVEPIQGEAGVRVPPASYLQALRQHCTGHQWLLMLDEVQTGMGRTGAWFAHQHEGIIADVLTLAKGLANGLPMGACLARGEAAELFTPGSHGSTFGGNPLACRVACTVLEIIEQENLLQRTADRGQTLLTRLQLALAGHSNVIDVRGNGLMLGIEFDRPCPSLMLQALQQHQLLINVTRKRVIRLLPPLIIDIQEIDRIVDAIAAMAHKEGETTTIAVD